MRWMHDATFSDVFCSLGGPHAPAAASPEGRTFWAEKLSYARWRDGPGAPRALGGLHGPFLCPRPSSSSALPLLAGLSRQFPCRHGYCVGLSAEVLQLAPTPYPEHVGHVGHQRPVGGRSHSKENATTDAMLLHGMLWGGGGPAKHTVGGGGKRGYLCAYVGTPGTVLYLWDRPAGTDCTVPTPAARPEASKTCAAQWPALFALFVNSTALRGKPLKACSCRLGNC
ncbi:hypothetical protein GQ53DRAFT_211945 [Thozetella sp. PMI_491]|nr:hypothetical protein GQ53DRAFT_211945 [Thozetella sp. PMI_491]